MTWTREDIEVSFIREFSTAECRLGDVLSTFDRSERVRIAIHKAARGDLPFFDSGMTYAEAFRLWSGKVFEMRLQHRLTQIHRFDVIDPDDDAEW
jgi:hypothetical protein